MVSRVIFILLISYIILLSPVRAETRVALVIGNSAYATGRLAHPTGDAKAVARLLSSSGFDVVELADGGRKAMVSTLKAFKRKVANADVALVFYAGHGMELDGENWLVPIDATLATDDDVSGEAISLKSVRQALDHARRLRVVILDACRDRSPKGRAYSFTSRPTKPPNPPPCQRPMSDGSEGAICQATTLGLG